MYMMTLSEKAYKEELCCCMRVQGAGDKEVRNSNSEGRLCPIRGQRGERGRGNVRADVEVGHYRKDCVESGGESLKHPGGLEGVSSKGQLRNKW